MRCVDDATYDVLLLSAALGRRLDNARLGFFFLRSELLLVVVLVLVGVERLARALFESSSQHTTQQRLVIKYFTSNSATKTKTQ